jgi:hypothetical protein
MTSELLFPVLQVVVSLALAFVGVEVSNRPPRSGAEGRTARIVYRSIFVIIGLASCGLTIVQAVRSAQERHIEQAAAHALAVKNESDMRAVKDGQS